MGEKERLFAVPSVFLRQGSAFILVSCNDKMEWKL